MGDLKQVKPDWCIQRSCDLQSRYHLGKYLWVEASVYNLLLKCLNIDGCLTQNCFVEIIRLIHFYGELNNSNDQDWFKILLGFIS